MVLGIVSAPIVVVAVVVVVVTIVPVVVIAAVVAVVGAGEPSTSAIHAAATGFRKVLALT